MVLLFIVLTLALLGTLSLGLSGLASLEHKAVIQSGYSAQLVQIVYSGIDTAGQAIDFPENIDLYDNPGRFCSIEVVPGVYTSSDFGAGRFTVFSPRFEQDRVSGIRFGLTRESAKLSLETVLAWENEIPGQGVRALEKLPGITTPMIDTILDWLDADDIARPQGGESEYYQQMQKSYRPRNTVPITLEELLLLRDIDQSLVFGNDASQMFGAEQSVIRIPQKTPADVFDLFSVLPETATQPPDIEMQPPDFEIPPAWCNYLTPYSAEKLVNSSGVVRVYLNESNIEFLDMQLRQHQIDEESIRFISAWRKEKGNIADMLDLLDMEIISDGETLPSPFSCSEPAKYERFLRLLDNAASSADIVLRGRININEAPKLILEAVPELSTEHVSKILERRNLIGEEYKYKHRHPVWLLAEEIVDKETMKKLAKRLTTGGDVYRFQVAGFFENKPMFHRAEAVLDATVKPPKCVYFSDL